MRGAAEALRLRRAAMQVADKYIFAFICVVSCYEKKFQEEREGLGGI